MDADWIPCVELVGFEPELLPSIATAHRALQALRTAAHDAPWTQAILRGLETIDYQRLPRHQTGWLSLRLGIPLFEEERCLELLRQTGQITWSDERYVPTHILAVDTRRSEEANRAQRRFWLSVASERLEQGRPGVWSYNVFGVSRADLARLKQLHADYYAQMRTIIAASEPVETVAVSCVQMFPLDREAG